MLKKARSLEGKKNAFTTTQKEDRKEQRYYFHTDTLVQSAKNKEVQRFASDTDTADCFCETDDVLHGPFSENSVSEIWEPLTEVP